MIASAGEPVMAEHHYRPEAPERLLDKLARVAANLADGSGAPNTPAEGRTKQTPPNFPHNPLKSFGSDERFKGNPRRAPARL